MNSGNPLGSGNALGGAQPNRRTSQQDKREVIGRDGREVNGREVNGREVNGREPNGREYNGREYNEREIHPYAYKTNTYGRQSPNAPHLLDRSESYLQGQTQTGKNRAAETNGFDMQRGDEDGGDVRKGFWGKFCC